MITFMPPPHLLDSPRGRDWPHPAAAPAARTDRPPGRADVVIVGAGPAGLAVASALWHLGVRDVAILDRESQPCARFFGRVDVLRQRVLRSPYEHHPGVEGYHDCELLDYARLHWSRLTPVERREIRMAQSGHRSVVPVDVFEAYCRQVATLHDVYPNLWQARVRLIRPEADGVAVGGDDFEVSAQYAVLCTGEERRPAPREWWIDAQPPPCVTYWDEPVPTGSGPLTVVGAGLTAAHLISNALRDGRQVNWVVRTEERYQCSDVNASFFRAEGRARFDGVPWEQRLALMRSQRRASVMFEFRPLLQQAQDSGQLVVHRGQAVEAITARDSGEVVVLLADGTPVTGDQAVLALGTRFSPGGWLLPSRVVDARDGWPDLDERTLSYRRAPRVFTVGAAAGMVLGPAARNIDGHRVATARVAGAIAAMLRTRGPIGREMAASG